MDEETAAESPRKKRGLLKILSGIFVAVGFFLLKVKGLLFLFFSKLKPLLANPFEGFGIIQFAMTGVSMALSLVAYAIKWGFLFGAGFVFLIVIHELGHAMAIRAKGLRASAMVFIPFIGGAVTLKDQPRSVYVDAQIGLAGPILGTLASIASYSIYQFNGVGLYLGLAYAGFVLNLLNLLPIGPLDGGRIAAAISKWMWVLGAAIVFWVMIAYRSPLLLLILVLGIFQIYRAIRETGGDSFYDITGLQRTGIAVTYFSLVLFLGYESVVTHVEVDRLLAQQ